MRALGLVLVFTAISFAGAGVTLAQSDDDIDALNRRVVSLLGAAKHGEALPLAERSIAMTRERHGEDHPRYATALNNLAQLFRATNRLAEAEPLLLRALAIREKSLGPAHPDVAVSLNNLASLLTATNRPAAAERLYRRALSIFEKSPDPEHRNVATGLNNLATALRETGRLAEAEALYRRMLAIAEKGLAPAYTAVALNNLAAVLQATNRLRDAETLFRRALDIDEKGFGPEHPKVARGLNNLGELLRETNRLAEAESLYRRALGIMEKSLGFEHPDVAPALNNLAIVLQETDRPAEAEPLYRRALAIVEKSLGREHPRVARSLINLSALLRRANRLAEAEPPARRAVSIFEKSLGHEHPDVAVSYFSLAVLLQEMKRPAEAERLMRQGLAIHEKSLGPTHPELAIDLNKLALLRAELGDWAEAARLHRRAAPIMTSAGGKATLASNTVNFRAAARALFRIGGVSAVVRGEAFGLAQQALQTGAADALGQMAVRFAKGTGPIAGLVRQRQDLLAARKSEDKRLLGTFGNADSLMAVSIRAAIAGIDDKVAAIDRRLAAEYPEYAQLSDPEPLTVAAAQSLLKEDEVLVLFLDVPRLGNLPEESLAWAITKGEARWISIPLGTKAFAERVARIRCGLDLEGQWISSGQRQRWEAKSEHCRALRPDGFAHGDPLPFDLAVAHELYAVLLAPFADLTKDKRLVVVPSGPLTSLPFHVLATKAFPLPAGGERAVADFRRAAWLALEQAITVLPSVRSLQALRKLPPTQAREPYIAFGNPLLDGGALQGELARLARAKQSCSPESRSPLRRVADAGRGAPRLDALVGGVDLALLRAQAPLPETTDELCAVARSLGALDAPGREAETVWLGARASETNLKALSRAGKLARYRVLHFATHGVLAGESEAILNAKAEPALILNPPKDGTTPAELEEDDGLLTASEVAQLELDADWVVLSACNTAAGDKGDAEALSGLARAFFYAKARALLVSHWYVNSEAAVELTTGAFAELSAHPEIGRAEALRRSMARLIARGRPDQAHPEYWAPFVLVGEDAT
jgi:CHAT domain-containing protein/tetratricopeptide (TPR) repeat protein